MALVSSGEFTLIDVNDGLSVHTITVYQQSLTQPSAPTGGSYNFTSRLLVPPTGWLIGLPSTTTTPTWGTTFSFFTNDVITTVLATTWSVPTIYSLQGVAGNNSGVPTIYFVNTSSSIAPTNALSGTFTYTFATGVLSGGTLNGWVTALPTVSAGQFIWARQASAVSNNFTDTIGAAEFSGAVCINGIGTNGLQGIAGLNSAAIFLYAVSTSNTTAPTAFSGTFIYTFSTKALSGGTLNGWAVSAPSVPAGSFLWFSQATALSNTDTDDIPAAEFSASSVLSGTGINGVAGAPGANGVAGNRGPGFYRAGSTSWSDLTANATVPGGVPVVSDIVTLFTTGYSETKQWSGTAWVAAALAIDGNLIVTGTINGSKIATKSISAEQIAAGTITADKITVGFGGCNLLTNSAPIVGGETSGWAVTWYNTNIVPAIVAGFDIWRPTGGGSVAACVSGSPTIGSVFDLGAANRIPVKAGVKYEVGAILSSHRCSSVLTLAFFNSAGTYIGEAGCGVVNSVSYSGALSSWVRSGGFITTLADTAYVSFYSRSTVILNDPYCFMAQAYLGEALVNQTIISPWSEGITGSGSIVSNDFTTIGGAGFRLKSNAAGTSADPIIYGAYIKGGTIEASTFQYKTDAGLPTKQFITSAYLTTTFLASTSALYSGKTTFNTGIYSYNAITCPTGQRLSHVSGNIIEFLALISLPVTDRLGGELYSVSLYLGSTLLETYQGWTSAYGTFYPTDFTINGISFNVDCLVGTTYTGSDVGPTYDGHLYITVYNSALGTISGEGELKLVLTHSYTQNYLTISPKIIINNF